MVKKLRLLIEAESLDWYVTVSLQELQWRESDEDGVWFTLAFTWVSPDTLSCADIATDILYLTNRLKVLAKRTGQLK
jgi:hypothetical protein